MDVFGGVIGVADCQLERVVFKVEGQCVVEVLVG